MNTEITEAQRRREYAEVDRRLAERRKEEGILNDLDRVIEKNAVRRMVGWIDVNGCQNSFHCFSRDTEGQLIISHGDDSVCGSAECSYSMQ